MDSTSQSSSNIPIQILKNPTDAQRHEMIRQSLIKSGRPEDYEYIIKNQSPPHGWIQSSLRSAKIACNGLAYYLKTHGYK